MHFKTSHQRSVTGNNIHVEIDYGTNEAITNVKIELDGFILADDDLAEPSDSYQNDFLNAGDAAPLMEHTLLVTATSKEDAEHSSTTNWVDAI
jgi:hypothetical protein